jgi:hypothetical protein
MADQNETSGITPRMDTAEFAARVAAPLKAPVTLGAGFDQRVMRAIEEAAQPWWRRRHTLTLSAPRLVAMAAAFIGFVALGTLGLARAFNTPTAVVASADTVHVVRFVLDAPNAQSVALVGDFNGWSRTATPLDAGEAPGRWTISLTLPSGRHEYAFVVDGEEWVADPATSSMRDEFGVESSIVRVGGAVRGL